MENKLHTKTIIQSIKLTKIAIGIMQLLIFIGIFWGPFFVSYVLPLSQNFLPGRLNHSLLIASGYLFAFLGFICLRLLQNILHEIEQGRTFSNLVINLLNHLEKIMLAVTLISLFVSLLVLIHLLIISIATVFMFFVIRIIRLSFIQAAIYKDELDYTI